MINSKQRAYLRGLANREPALYQAASADVVQVIGNKFVLYKESEENKKIELPVKS